MIKSKPTALLLGRFQPFHQGHQALIRKALSRHGQVLVGIRQMPEDKNNPFGAYAARSVIEGWAAKELSTRDRLNLAMIVLPNIVSVIHGRTPGWKVERLELPPDIEAISATEIRKQRGIGGSKN